ncbi:unnamed protein product [Linum trigynum]|uniref:Uncharacterized protein n=1 Tax=Linum trigynum TaxID=586398 RepID=A0AAV2GLE9_9ROSI
MRGSRGKRSIPPIRGKVDCFGDGGEAVRSSPFEHKIIVGNPDSPQCSNNNIDREGGCVQGDTLKPHDNWPVARRKKEVREASAPNESCMGAFKHTTVHVFSPIPAKEADWRADHLTEP